MRKRQTSTNALRVGINFGLIVAIFIVGVLIVQLSQPQDPPIPQEQTYFVELEDYHYFQFDELTYGFILARIEITSNQLFGLDLQKMITNEQVLLSDTLNYKTPLIESGYRLGCPGTDEVSGLQANICVFIPVINRDANELVLKINLDRPHNVSFNLLDNAHFGTKAMLGVTEVLPSYVATILKYRNVSTRSFTIEDAEGGTIEAPFNSQSRVLGFQLRIQSQQVTTTLETATCTLTGYGTFQLVNADYTNDEEESILGMAITTERTGYLFFEITDPAIDLMSLDPSIISLSLRAAGETQFIVVVPTP
jgi:hypothetical protein